MKICHVETLISAGDFPDSDECIQVRDALHTAIRAVDWPDGSGTFTIYPESGKKRNQGNGVKPIKNSLISELISQGWFPEKRVDIVADYPLGKVDAILEMRQGGFAVEWETGNISSSHRALNKMCIGLRRGALIGGTLIVPSRDMYRYLTDRVGNWNELRPYLELWKEVPVKEGLLEIVVIEHDATSFDVPRIPKGTDGRAVL